MQVTVEAIIHAPPKATFALAADIPHWPQAMSAVRAVEMLTPGPVAVGTRFRETRLMFGQQATEEMTVAEFEPPRGFVLTAVNHGTAYRAEHLFEPHGAGTRVQLLFEGWPISRLAKLFTPLGRLFLGSVRRHLAADLADLKREAERRHASCRARSA